MSGGGLETRRSNSESNLDRIGSERPALEAHSSSGTSDPTNTKSTSKPGGLAQNGGNRTPRKVQWAPNTKEPHHLDERGLDPSAFETLTDALERHRSTSSEDILEDIHIEVPHIDVSSTITPASISPGTEAPSPTKDVPAFIGPLETAGLPAAPSTSKDPNAARARTAASRMVKAHSHRLNLFSGYRTVKKEKLKVSKTSARNTVTVKDVEREAPEAHTYHPPLGSGVLSALLSLYNHQDSASSTNISRPSSPASSSPPSPSGEAQSGSRRIYKNQNRSTRSLASVNAVKNAAKSFAGNVSRNDRPSHARSSAGVFGPLIAGTANLSGAAAPTPSTVAPNPKRPGYRLSRYSLDETKVKEIRSSMNRPQSIALDNLPNGGSSGPPSTTGSSPPSPPIEYERTPLSGAPVPSLRSNGTSRQKWNGVLTNLPNPKRWSMGSDVPSGVKTPNSDVGDYFDDKNGFSEPVHRTWSGWSSGWSSGDTSERDRPKAEKRKKRKKAEIYITRHVAQIMQRQEFILKLTRTFMMFGAPSHRLQAQIYATAKVLEIDLSCMYLPDVMLISFDDVATSTSNIKFIRQGSALDLGKLHESYKLYWKVIHDEISVSDASICLDTIMREKPLYNWWQLMLIGGFCSSAICSVSFYGSFIDSVVSYPLGALLVGVQLLSVRNELYSNVFEITIATLLSFLSAAIATSTLFCYSAIASSSIVLILPGYIVLSGSLELSSRNIVSGAVRLCFAVMYALFLGFGLSIGGTIYQEITHRGVLGADYACTMSHDPNGPWWQQTPAEWWAFLTVPMYSLFLTLRQQAPWHRKELIITVLIACVGWTCNHFSATKFVNRSDVSSAIGAFSVGLLGNIYGRFFEGNAFIIMITGILFQLPSGLGNGGLLSFATDSNEGSSTSYLSGFQTALQLISVSLGLTVGLGISLVVVHPIPSRKRASGIFSL